MSPSEDLPLPNLTVQQLEYLVAVSTAPTWSAAAAQVGVTPSALSQGLAELERRIGVKMFERRGRLRVLAASAQPVLDHAISVVAGTRELARWANRHHAGDAGLLRIGMVDAAAITIYPNQLRRFRASHPNLRLRLTVAPSGELLDLLRRAALDAVVCIEPRSVDASLELRSLRTEALFVFAPPDAAPDLHPSAWGPWVSFPAGAHSRAVVSEALTSLGAPVDVVAESHQPEVLREMVHLGLGWAVLPAQRGDKTTAPYVPAPVATRQLVFARRRDAAPNPATDILLEQLTV